MASEIGLQSQSQGGALELLNRVLQALAGERLANTTVDMSRQIFWRIPGRSPIAGELVGPEAVIARFQLMRQTTASDRPAELVALLEGDHYAAVVQRNHIERPDGGTQPLTAVTLAKAEDGRLVELLHLVSDQYAVDELWSEML